MSITKIVCIFFLAGIVLSCEKVIDIPLNEADQRIVVEAVLKDSPGDNYILLSKTGGVYTENNFEKISGAVVRVTDISGAEFLFSEDTVIPGKYSNASLEILPNNSYTLMIDINGTSLTSTCKTFYKPTLDSLAYIEQIGTFGFGTDTTYLVFYNFVDNATQENFYRVVPFINGKKQSATYVIDDELFNGQTYTAPIFASTVNIGDTVIIELTSFDKANYSYFSTLANASAGANAPTPANPVSNINGNAIGYFGAYTTDTLSIILPL